MGGDAPVVQGLGDAHRAEQVDLHGRVERAVEADRCGRVDDDVAAGEQGRVVFLETESVCAHVAADGCDPAGDHLVEGLRTFLGHLGFQPVEGVVLEDLAPGALGGVVAFAGADEEHQLTVRNTAQQSLDQRGAHEPCTAGDGNALPG